MVDFWAECVYVFNAQAKKLSLIILYKNFDKHFFLYLEYFSDFDKAMTSIPICIVSILDTLERNSGGLYLATLFVEKWEQHSVPWPRANKEFLKISWKNNRNISIFNKSSQFQIEKREEGKTF